MIDEPLPGVGDESAHHAAYLSYYRDQFIDGVLTLPAEDRRRSLVPSGWTPIELLSHVLHMERRWFLWRFRGDRINDPYGDWQGGDHHSRWAVEESVTAEELADRLRAVGEQVTGLLGEHEMDDRAVAVNGAEHPDLELRWICFHVLQEYARHAGHLDIVVELS